ncbi:MAG: lysophospholipid acyltransferase family protein [Candidatus Amulumruptor caecigallinarius]|nr:lysophospholipid acyltransferase family protein [Candidatus Amulumruptor caecigallinarius]
MKPIYVLTYSALKLLSLLPFRVIYLLSDLLAGFMHSIIRYRRKVVRENLESSFPEKNDTELRRIERDFYRFLTDYMLETVKMLSMSDDDIRRHMFIENPEMVDEAFRRGRNVALLLGHYCNWEWVSSLPLNFKSGIVPAQVYHHLHNKVMNDIFMKIRTKFHSNNLEMSEILRQLIVWKKEGKLSVTGFIADQAPNLDIHLFVDFLNHDTPVYTGPERIAKFLDAEVLFCHLHREKRGFYRLRFVKITGAPKTEKVFDVSRKYFEMLESNIREAPQYWLWSHKRWKRTRKMFNDYWGDNADKQLSHL